MTQEIDEVVRTTLGDTYNKGYAAGYAAGIAAAAQHMEKFARDSRTVVGAYRPPLDVLIDELGLSSRIRLRLLKAGVKTIADVYNYNEKKERGLISIRSFGPDSYGELSNRLVERGYAPLVPYDHRVQS